MLYDKISGDTYKMKIDFVEFGTPSKGSHSGAYLFIPDGSGRVSYLFYLYQKSSLF